MGNRPSASGIIAGEKLRAGNRLAAQAARLENAGMYDRMMDIAENSLALKHQTQRYGYDTEKYKSDNEREAQKETSRALNNFPGFNSASLLKGLNTPSVAMYDKDGNLIGGSSYGS